MPPQCSRLTASVSSVLVREWTGCTGVSMLIGLRRAEDAVKIGRLAIELELGSSPDGGASEGRIFYCVYSVMMIHTH